MSDSVDIPQPTPFRLAQVVYNSDTETIEIRVPVVNGPDRILATIAVDPE